MRHIISSLIWLIAAGFVCNAQTLTLKECIHTGIANNLSIANARIDINKGHTAISQNRARLLPVLNGVFQFTDYLKRPVNVTTGTLLGNDFPEDPTWQTIRSMQYNVNAGVSLNLPIYDASIFASVNVAETVERLHLLSYEKAIEDLTVQISKVYYLAQTSLAQASLAEENITRMSELCSITEAMYEQGVVMEVDLNRARINLQNIETQHDLYKTLHKQQLNMLRFLLDLSPETPIEVENMCDDVEMYYAEGVSKTLPELELLETQRDLVDKQISAVKSGYIPKISLTGYAGGLGYQDKFSHYFHTKESSQNWFGNCFIGLNITIPLFDGNLKKYQISQYRQDALQADNRKELLNKQLEENRSDALLQLKHNLNVFHTQSQSYRQAQDVYKVTEDQYREGISSMTALLQDEMQLRTAQAACVQAHCQFNLARLDLLKLSGNLSELTN